MNAAALRRAVLAGYLSLFPLLVLRYCWLAPPAHVSPWMPLVLMLLPMLLPMGGLIAGRRYTYKWSCFVALIYLIYAVDSLFMDGWSRVLGLGETLASLSWFGFAMLYVRATRERPER